MSNAKSSNELAQDRTYHCTYRKYPLILAALLGGLGIAMLVEALLNPSG